MGITELGKKLTKFKFNRLFNLELLEAHGLTSKQENILVELNNKERNYQNNQTGQSMSKFKYKSITDINCPQWRKLNSYYNINSLLRN